MDGTSYDRDADRAEARYRYGYEPEPGDAAYERPDSIVTDGSGFRAYPGPGETGHGETGYGEPRHALSSYGETGYGETGYGQNGYGDPVSNGYRQLPFDAAADPGSSSYGSPSYGSTGHGSTGHGSARTSYPWSSFTEPEQSRGGSDGRDGYPPSSYRDLADDDTVAGTGWGAPFVPASTPSPALTGPSGGRGQVVWREPSTGWLTGEREAEPSASDGESEGRQRSGRPTMPLWQELPLLIVVAFCLAVLIRTFLLQAFYIPSGSMEQTLLVGDRVLVNKIVYDVRPPARGEVIVFRGTDAWATENISEPEGGPVAKLGRALGDLIGVSRPGDKDFIKRVIAVPGDRVSCCDPKGRVYVNGKGIDEPYVINNSPEEVDPDPRVCRSRRFDEVLVPPGQLFVMGDHRIVSQDSRCQGTVPIENVVGRAFIIVWPGGRWGTLPVPETFASVPPPVALPPTVSGAPYSPSPPITPTADIATVALLAAVAGRARSVPRRRLRRRTLLR